SSMRPLYSAACALRTDSGFLAGDLSACADLTSSTGGVAGATVSFGLASEAAWSEFSVDASVPGSLAAFSTGAGSVSDGGGTVSLGEAEVLLRSWRTSS